ncbi:MAG TPA: amidohydrolase family protein, partial [Steroidobacteraceae bacterium]|nr:amidohydrolase family protein [Steroidobacteraceae bacterium]
MTGYIDIVCNLFDPVAVRNGQTGIDEEFKRQVRMDPAIRGGVTAAQYLKRMDRAGIERSLLIAVRAGDLAVKGSFELPYERVHRVCEKYPDRYAGLAGVDPFRGMQGLKDLEYAVNSLGFVGAHLYPHWFALAPDHAKYYPYYAKCCELDVPIMM